MLAYTKSIHVLLPTHVTTESIHMLAYTKSIHVLLPTHVTTTNTTAAAAAGSKE